MLSKHNCQDAAFGSVAMPSEKGDIINLGYGIKKKFVMQLLSVQWGNSLLFWCCSVR